jgi:hypothetical protein
MSIDTLKSRLRDLPGIETLTMRLEAGQQIFTLNGVVAAVDPLATDSEIERAIHTAARLPPVNLTENRPMSITGANYLAGSIKQKIQAAKDRIANVHAATDAALTKMNAAADTGDQIAKAIDDEATGLLAELGQFSNGGPG